MDERAPLLASAANFRVLIDGVDIGLSHVTGMTSADDAVQRAATVTLRRAVIGDRTLFEWRRDVAAGRADPREVVVEVYVPDHSTLVASWALLEARPVRWSGPDLDAIAGGVAFEELELTYDRVDWRFPKPRED